MVSVIISMFSLTRLYFYTIYFFFLLHLVNFVLHLLCVRVVLPLYCLYICVFMDMFVNVMSVFTEICLHTLYHIILGCNPYWDNCNLYFLYMIHSATVTILIDLHLLWFINTSLFEFAV